MSFRFPDQSSRTTIMGATGSGKTRFGIWLQGNAAQFKRRPYTFIDYKGDDLIAQIDRLEEIDVKDKPPKHPGGYVLRPDADDPRIEDWLNKVKEQGNHGLFFDEGYMVPSAPPRFKALNRILTQGRSLRIPTVILTQRPVWMTRFARSEAGFFAIFRMQDVKDYETVHGFVPQNSVFDFSSRLPEYHARWYDVSKDYSAIIKPVPLDPEILDIYDLALRKTIRSV